MGRRFKDDPLADALASPEGVRELSVEAFEGETLPDGFERLRELETLSFYQPKNLRFARGLEGLASLQTLSIFDAPSLDYSDLFIRAANLPALTELAVDSSAGGTLPVELEGLSGLLRIDIFDASKVNLEKICLRLSGLSGLRILKLIENYKVGIVILPPAIGELKQITKLWVNAPCSAFPTEIGQLASLESLVLDSPIRKRAALKTLPAEIGQLRKLRQIRLRGHSIKVIPDSICNLRELKGLDLFGSPFVSLPEKFGNLTNLKYLDLSFCENLSVLPDSFGDLYSLRTFYAGGSGLTTLPNSFHNLRLQECTLPGNLLSTVKLAPPDVAYVDELEITRPHDLALPEDLGDPKRLSIRAPKLKEPAIGFSRLRRLQSLSIARAPNFDLADAIARLDNTQLKSLRLDSWELTALPNSIGVLTQLESLSLNCNSLKTLPDEIGALVYLQSLNLSENPFTSFPETCTRLTKLSDLSLWSFPCPELPKGLGLLQSLKRLQLGRSKLQNFSSELFGLVNLEEFDLKASEIPDVRVFGRLPKLRILHLDQCRHVDLAALAEGLSSTQIEHLSLQSLRESGEALPPAIGELKTLRSLDIRSSGITKFPPEFARLTALSNVTFQDFNIAPSILKRCLPPGKWRKEGKGDRTMYIRADEIAT